MTTFDKREDGFENRFAHDAAIRFKVEARRNKLLGLWVAEKLGHEGEAAQVYAQAVVKSDLEEPGEEDVFRKVRGDLDKSGTDVSDDEIRAKMAELLVTAKDQIRTEV